MPEDPKHSPEIARILRLELERIALRLERLRGNSNYVAAYKNAARIVRDAKPD